MRESDERGDLINKLNEALRELHNLLRKSHDEHLDLFLHREINRYASKEMLGHILADAEEEIHRRRK